MLRDLNYFRRSESKQQVNRITYENIRKDIVLNKLPAKSKLKLSLLSDKYSASILTLRNVLYILSSEGFVVAEEQRGFFVAPLSKSNLRELADLRYLLEKRMLELSYKQGDLEWESKIQAAYHMLQKNEELLLNKEQDSTQMFNLKLLDYAFHKALISKCESQELLSMHKNVFDKYLRYLLYGSGFRGKMSMEEHQIFLQSALSRNTKIAKKTLKKHIYECVAKLCNIDSKLERDYYRGTK